MSVDTAVQVSPAIDTLPKPNSEPNYDDWFDVRRFYIGALRSQTRRMILILALAYAMERTPPQLVYAGRHGYPGPSDEDFGLIYCIAYMFSWLYLCVFFIFWTPLFSWWVPDGPVNSNSSVNKCIRVLHKINQVWPPFCAGVMGAVYLFFLVEAFIYVGDFRNEGRSAWRKPKNSKKIWKVRGLLLGGITMTIGCGYGALRILKTMELARVKPLEYALCIIPVQINIGLMIATKLQKKMEKRAAMKAMYTLVQASEEKVNMHGVVVEASHGAGEKTPIDGTNAERFVLEDA